MTGCGKRWAERVKKGVNQWCFPDGTELDDLFALSRVAGFDGVELNLNKPGGVGFTTSTTERDARNLRRMADSHGIELTSLSTGLLWDFPLSDPDPVVRREGRRVVEKQLTLASAAGMDAVLVVPGMVTPTVPYEECFKRSQDELAPLIDRAAELGVRIAVENVWNKFLLSPLDMSAYIDDFASAFVGAYFDVGNVLLFGYPEQWIRHLGSRIVKVHVKDFSVRVGTMAGFVPLLAGDVNWPGVILALADIGYGDYLTAELSPYGQYPLQLIPDTARQLDRILAGLREGDAP